jgi:hypothetical protein
MALCLLALRAGSAPPPPPQGRFLVVIFVRGRDNPMTMVRLEGLGELKKKIEWFHRESNQRPSGL